MPLATLTTPLSPTALISRAVPAPPYPFEFTSGPAYPTAQDIIVTETNGWSQMSEQWGFKPYSQWGGANSMPMIDPIVYANGSVPIEWGIASTSSTKHITEGIASLGGGIGWEYDLCRYRITPTAELKKLHIITVGAVRNIINVKSGTAPLVLIADTGTSLLNSGACCTTLECVNEVIPFEVYTAVTSIKASNEWYQVHFVTESV